ncbi:DUF5694 domain-containing protein [Fodinibius sediminis]|uniref:TraB family protein n=1 Tax=Fodinibius sediminis TaxID=1214077 RepID=A0A521EK92_9BACT|nr:DUF5694 domain-containing protein [Fodinibius sediminis]SMO84338.1 hypothetical protein SAMN06265218_1179 [Fodinibius sediminis]
MRTPLPLFFISFILIANAASAQDPGVSEDPRQLGKKSNTEVLVLATPHLRQIEYSLSPNMLDSLINVLENYAPDIIGIEALPGTQISEMRRRGGVYQSVVNRFADKQLNHGNKAREMLNLSWNKADDKANALLKYTRLSQTVADSTRLNLVNHLLASYRLHTAALQWSYVDKKKRLKQSTVSRESAIFLNELLESEDEISSISLRLAHALNLQRLYPIDDHMEKDVLADIKTGLTRALDDSTVQTVKNAPYRRKYKQILKQGIEDRTLFPLYQYMNSSAYIKQDQNVQWRNTFLDSSNPFLRKRLALWEVRNLNIAAHIRKASTEHTGGRLLVVIGASHKAFLDSYFNRLMGIEVLTLSDLLKS